MIALGSARRCPWTRAAPPSNAAPRRDEVGRAQNCHARLGLSIPSARQADFPERARPSRAARLARLTVLVRGWYANGGNGWDQGLDGAPAHAAARSSRVRHRISLTCAEPCGGLEPGDPATSARRRSGRTGGVMRWPTPHAHLPSRHDGHQISTVLRSAAGSLGVCEAPPPSSQCSSARTLADQTVVQHRAPVLRMVTGGCYRDERGRALGLPDSVRAVYTRLRKGSRHGQRACWLPSGPRNERRSAPREPDLNTYAAMTHTTRGHMLGSQGRQTALRPRGSR